MELIHDIHTRKHKAGKAAISFEFFPPKTEEGERILFEKTLPELMELNPDYCSVTYGAGGTTRDKTLSIVEKIQNDFKLTAMSHLTCVNATRDEVRAVIEDAKSRGITNLLALRGDPPGGVGDFKATEGGMEYSYQLVELIRELGGFSIGVAGFPEGHIACKEGKEVDWQRLKKKIDCGSDFVVTQLFFDNQDFFQFQDYLQNQQNVTCPIIPGVFPILNAKQIKKFTEMCGAILPSALISQLKDFEDDPEGATEFGIEYATQQCRELLDAGVPGIHFYTLNKTHSTARILKNLGLA
jgi:methylenetetrahydrofolate reductase (NADPH)